MEFESEYFKSNSISFLPIGSNGFIEKFQLMTQYIKELHYTAKIKNSIQLKHLTDTQFQDMACGSHAPHFIQ